ncbi:MAG: hypothetical protein PHP50_11160 [Lachnospiraceae bacterium]|nr:hypothetical protein [Lachnospiraceae bacterium]
MDKDTRLADLFGIDEYNRPSTCKECGGVMVFKGVGEYQCEDCGALDYDDYGKVRNYIEEKKGGTAFDIEQATGVSQKKIRMMLREGRLEVAMDSKSFLKCEICGVNIRSGRLCPKCELNVHRQLESEQRTMRVQNSTMSGVSGQAGDVESGAKRYTRH